jgi:hypothetical protein
MAVSLGSICSRISDLFKLTLEKDEFCEKSSFIFSVHNTGKLSPFGRRDLSPIGSTEEKEHCKKSNNLSIKRQGKRKSAKKRLENLSGVLESACNSDENGRQCEKEVFSH